MNDVVLPDASPEVLRGLLQKYREDLATATSATTNALQQLRQQLTVMERNQIVIMAQKAFLDTLEKDLTTSGVLTNPNQQENGKNQNS